MGKGATVKLVFDPRTNKAKVRVTFNRQPRLYSTLCNDVITKEEFDNDKLKKTKTIIASSESALTIAQNISNELGSNFSFTHFTRLYKERLYGNKASSDRFDSVAKQYIANLNTPSSISIYRTASNWMLRYNKDITLSSIDSSTVTTFIDFIKEKHKNETHNIISENTIRIYLRSLRAIYNKAIEDGICHNKNPFTHIKGQPLTSIIREKGALSDDEFKKFIKYQPSNKLEKYGKDMFLLSFALSGANIGDIFSLKNQNIVGDEVLFIRRKTKKSGLRISIPLIAFAKEILSEYGHIAEDKPNEYILPFLSRCNNNEKTIHNTLHDNLRKINKGLAMICENIGIRKITTYNARHTYASFAQNSMSAEQIQKFLGHASSRTTQVYLGSITQQVKDKNRELLENTLSNIGN